MPKASPPRSSQTTPGPSTSSAATARASGTSTATSTSTSTTASASVYRPRQPGGRRGGQGEGRPGHALRGAHRGLDRRRRGAGQAPFSLPQWRFTNSGTESTMDAVHLSRGATGRDLILKIEGSYHGHHDAVMVSVYPDLDQLGDRDDPRLRRLRRRPPEGCSPTSPAPCPSTTPTRSRACSASSGPGRRPDHGAGDDEHQHHPAARGLPRARARAVHAAHGVKLIFDEVKTGATIGYGGATKRFGVQAGPGHPGQGGLRRLPRRRDRHDRGAAGLVSGGTHSPVRDLQRQPAGDGGVRGRP